MYYYEIYLDGRLIDTSNCEYESREEADSECNFAISSYADSMDRHWSEFQLEIYRA